MNNKLYAEWIDFYKEYRIYDPAAPRKTLAWDRRDIDEINDDYVRKGYEGVSECDADTMHIENYDLDDEYDLDDDLILPEQSGGRK